MEYLDREGGKHLATKLKSYVNDKVADLPSGGTVDLSNYYTKSEVDKIVGNISGGTGKDGVGISNMKLVNYELIITLTDGAEHNLGNIRGDKGERGENGIDGVNGKDGAKGQDGFSPTIEVTNITDGHKIAITDVNGTQSFDVLNGKDGKDGVGGGSSGGGSDGVYSTDETAIGTWIDGKTIYRKVIQVPKLDSIDGNFDMTTVPLDLSTEFLVNVRPIWKYGEASPSWIFGNYTTFGLDTYINSTSNISSSLNENVKNQLYVSADFSAKSKSIIVWRGKNMRGYACTLIVEYTKL